MRLELLSRLGKEDWTDFGSRNVIVTDKTVHLRGLVGSPEERKALLALAESVPGVAKDVAHAEFLGDAAHIHRLVLEREAGVAGDDEEARRLRELGDEILGQAIGEELLLGVGAQICEGEHGDRGLGGQRQALGSGRLAGSGDAVDPDRRGDILQRPLAEIVNRRAPACARSRRAPWSK